MGDNVVIKLRDGEKDELIETRPDGTEHTYYRRAYGVNLICTELRVRQGFPFRGKEDGSTPLMEYFVDGKAWLSDNYGISVIGEPKNKTREVSVQLRIDDRKELLELREGDVEMSPGEADGRAHLGFNRADREIKSEDDWFLSCFLNSASLQPVIDAVMSATVKQVNLRVKLTHLYSDDPPYVPFDDSNLYLRPSLLGNTLDFPESADGFLVGFLMDFTTIDVRPPQEQEPAEPAEETMGSEKPVDPMLPAVQLLGAHRGPSQHGKVGWWTCHRLLGHHRSEVETSGPNQGRYPMR